MVSYDPSLLSQGTKCRFPGSEETVVLVSVQQGAFWDFFYVDSAGVPGTITLSEAEVSDVAVVAESDIPGFDGDPRRFRLGVEAIRIRDSFRHDMAALAVSAISPLPHQLEVVYGTFLEEPRLRFLLADDPGAGKTIMAGLYLKELQLRRAADRVLIVTPANLRPQWQRELAERFDIHCVQFDTSMFDANPTQNPWDAHDFVIVSRDFIKREGILETFCAAEKEWDLAVIDEAHGYTIGVDGKGVIKRRSERYKAGEKIAEKAHRLILLTATPHSGKTESLWALLRLLDSDAYGDRCPTTIDFNPQQYRKVPKEHMVDMAGNPLFKPRFPHTVEYHLEGAELALYEAVTDFVSRLLAEIRGDQSRATAGFALTTMQRRLASSVRAIRRTLERRVDRLERALEDPEAYIRSRRAFRNDLGLDDVDEIDDMDEDLLWELEERALEEWLPTTVQELNDEVQALRPLLVQAEDTERLGSEVKFNELRGVLSDQGLHADRSLKLLIFTEHKDTLDFLVESLSADFDVVTIHGGMKLRERIAAEKAFRERAQILVATEAAGEGINLQFCHLMVNYDIPWNPNRLEQRMGRIHRIGQKHAVHIFNLVAKNTLEGHVLATLLKKMENMGEDLGDKVFDVIGETFAGFRLRDLLERVLIGDLTREEAAAELGGTQVDAATKAKFEELTAEALASHHLDWEVEANRAARAEERRLPPGYLERFFRDGVDLLGGVTGDRLDPGTLRVSKTPDNLVARSRLAGATREIFPTYERLTFDKAVALRLRTTAEEQALPEPELCGAGHPLFDALVDSILDRCKSDVEAGAIFTAPGSEQNGLVYFLSGECLDGNNELVHRAMATVVEPAGGALVGERVFLYDLLSADGEPPATGLTDSTEVVNWARRHEFERHFQRVCEERGRVADIQEDYLRRSFASILNRYQQTLFDLDEEVELGRQGSEGRLRRAELTKTQVETRRDLRLGEANRGRNVRRGPVRILAVAALISDNDDDIEPTVDKKHSNAEIEQIAIEVSTRYEESIRRVDSVVSVESDNVGFDLLSFKNGERRCIEVKGRAGVGNVELTWSEFAKATELGDAYWLYVVLDCARPDPRLYRVQNPAHVLAAMWKPNLDVRYRIDPEPIIDAAENEDD
jgi:superfamily II DNA or RNA helicase